MTTTELIEGVRQLCADLDNARRDLELANSQLARNERYIRDLEHENGVLRGTSKGR
jgi:hypothetical protein